MNKEKKITLYSVIGAICCIICALLYSSRFDFELARYGWGEQRKATVQIIVFLMIAILLFFRKKNIIWIIPFVALIWLWKLTYSSYFASYSICPAMLKIGVACYLLAYVTMLLILLCNTISAFEKAAMRINKFIWFIPAILMFVGFGGWTGRAMFHQVLNYLELGLPIIFEIYEIQPLVEALMLLCIGIWIKNIYQEPKTSKVHISKPQKVECNYTKSETVVSNDIYCGMAKHVLLLLFTFGIWYLIWIYRMTGYTNAAENEEYRNPTKKLLLCMFIPFYSIYWTYKTAQRVDKMAGAKGISSDMTTLCLILAIFVPLIPPILLQDVMNKIAMASDTQPVSNQKEDIAKEMRTDTADEIKKFKELLDSGAITQEEFDTKKKQLLGL